MRSASLCLDSPSPVSILGLLEGVLNGQDGQVYS